MIGNLQTPIPHFNTIGIGNNLEVAVYTKTPISKSELRNRVKNWDDLDNCDVDFHRPEEDGPAVTIVQNTPGKPDGHQRTVRMEYWRDGKRHRDNGNAVIYGPPPKDERWIDGQQID